MTEKCSYCGAYLPPGMKRCVNAKCREWNLKHTSAKQISEFIVPLSDATKSTISRIKTNLVDKVWGGGIVSSSVCILGGEPGAGKTTLCLTLSDIFCGLCPGKRALYIANEQSVDEIRITGERLKLKHLDRIDGVKAMGGIPYDIGTVLLQHNPCICILDSVTKWSGEDMREAVIIVQRLKDYAVRLNCPMIVINHIIKSGDQAGLKDLEHESDMNALFNTLEAETDREGNKLPGPLSPRHLISTKNRYGAAPEEQFFMMTESGLIETFEFPDGGWPTSLDEIEEARNLKDEL